MTPSLVSPAFRRLVWSNLAAQSAEQIGAAATPLVAVVAFGAGEGATGLLQVAQTLPFVLFALPLGLLADRLPRPALMAGAETIRAVSLLAILVLAATGHLTLALLALLGFAGACGTVGYSVAAPALLPALVPTDALSAANGRLELARTAAFAAGPALGGALVGSAGAPVAFGIAASLSVGAAILLAGIREPARPALVRRHPWTEIREGASFVFGHALLRPVFLTQLVFNTAFFVVMAVYVPYAVETLRLSPSEVGLTLAAYGIGMVLGALLGARLMRVVRFGTVVAAGPFSATIGALVLLATLWLPSPLLAGLAFFLFGAGPILWVISTTTLRQTVTPPRLLGRVSAINIVAYGARPLGAGIGALVGSRFGAAPCLAIGAALFGLQATMILVSPLVRLRVPPIGPDEAQPSASGGLAISP